jgi:hypothetical protein
LIINSNEVWTHSIELPEDEAETLMLEFSRAIDGKKKKITLQWSNERSEGR